MKTSTDSLHYLLASVLCATMCHLIVSTTDTSFTRQKGQNGTCTENIEFERERFEDFETNNCNLWLTNCLTSLSGFTSNTRLDLTNGTYDKLSSIRVSMPQSQLYYV